VLKEMQNAECELPQFVRTVQKTPPMVLNIKF